MEPRRRINPKTQGGWFWVNNEIFEYLSNSDIAAYAGWVYVFLVKTSNARTQQCWWSRKRIARETGISESSVSRSIQLLEERRIIAISRQRGDKNIYTLLHKNEWSPISTNPVSIGHRSEVYKNSVAVSRRNQNKTPYSETHKQGLARLKEEMRARMSV